MVKKENEVEGIKYKKEKQKRRGYGRKNTNMYMENYTETEERKDKDWCYKSTAVLQVLKYCKKCANV
jgi:hypothetical protein